MRNPQIELLGASAATNTRASCTELRFLWAEVVA
jgi:hypothetical protein